MECDRDVCAGCVELGPRLGSPPYPRDILGRESLIEFPLRQSASPDQRVVLRVVTCCRVRLVGPGYKGGCGLAGELAALLGEEALATLFIEQIREDAAHENPGRGAYSRTRRAARSGNSSAPDESDCDHEDRSGHNNDPQ